MTTTIPETLTKYQSLYTLTKREGRVLLYALTRRGKPWGFEVMIAQHREPAMLGGKLLPGGEALPSSSHWGVFGWSYPPGDEARANDKFATCCIRFSPPPEPVRIVRRKLT